MRTSGKHGIWRISQQIFGIFILDFLFQITGDSVYCIFCVMTSQISLIKVHFFSQDFSNMKTIIVRVGYFALLGFHQVYSHFRLWNPVAQRYSSLCVPRVDVSRSFQHFHDGGKWSFTKRCCPVNIQFINLPPWIFYNISLGIIGPIIVLK